MKIAGLILIVVGVLALVYQSFPYTQTKQEAKIGSLELQYKETHDVPVPPIIGGICIAAGVAALFVGRRGK